MSNKTRISCANFTLVSEGEYSSGIALPTGTGKANGSYPAPTGTGGGHHPSHEPTFTPADPTQPPQSTSTSGADKLMVAGAGLLAGVVALLF